jgi:hypothetical protein
MNLWPGAGDGLRPSAQSDVEHVSTEQIEAAIESSRNAASRRLRRPEILQGSHTQESRLNAAWPWTFRRNRNDSPGERFCLKDAPNLSLMRRDHPSRSWGLAIGGEFGSAIAPMPNDGSQFFYRHRHRQKKPQAHSIRQDRRSLSVLRSRAHLGTSGRLFSGRHPPAGCVTGGLNIVQTMPRTR